ncbi:MAG: hypothetical protein IT385_12515 [Deltaproteobacteria bacterium]|nr:hypothetical protein [Deltaproteobacteria bacterium]
MAQPLTQVQALLAARAQEAWDQAELTLRQEAEPRGGIEHLAGARLAFHGIDPTSQRPHPVGRAIVLTVDDERFVVPLDDELSRRIGQLREAQALFGWPIGREVGWNAVGEIVQTHQVAPATPGTPSREHDLALREIHIPGQLLIDAEGRIPALDEAMSALDEAQKGVTLPASATPDALVGLLPRVLGAHHWRAFVALCDESLSTTDKRMAFEQFCQAWDISRDSISFVDIDGDPLTIGDGEVVRTRVKRTGQKGEELVRPLRWIKRGVTWRYLGGIL